MTRLDRPLDRRLGRHRALTLPAAGTALEGVALLVVCVVYVVRGVVGHPDDRPTAIGGGVLGLLLGVLLLLLARGIAHARRVALTPVLLTQLLALPVGWSLLRAGQYVAGGVVLVLALGVLALLFVPREARDAFR